MSLKRGVYGHAAGYQAGPGELLAAARAQIAGWNAYSPGDTCGPRHKMRAMDQDGCSIRTRAELVGRADGESAAVIKFCLVCGLVEWAGDRLGDPGDTAVRLAAPWTLGRTYQLAYHRAGADGAGSGAGEFTYRGLTTAGGTHRFDPVAGGPALYLHRDEVSAAR